MNQEDLVLLGTISAAATGVLVLAEGLERAELDRSRMTRREVSRLLLVVADAVGELSSGARSAIPDLDVPAWLLTAARLQAGGAVESEARWSAIQSLAPTTLSWIKFHSSGRTRKVPDPEQG